MFLSRPLLVKVKIPLVTTGLLALGGIALGALFNQPAILMQCGLGGSVLVGATIYKILEKSAGITLVERNSSYDIADTEVLAASLGSILGASICPAPTLVQALSPFIGPGFIMYVKNFGNFTDKHIMGRAPQADNQAINKTNSGTILSNRLG